MIVKNSLEMVSENLENQSIFQVQVRSVVILQLQLATESAAQRHAARSGHVNFSESTTPIKPLTPEEKAAKLAEIKQRLSEKREQRLLTEQEEARSREKIRRKSGKDLTDLKEKLETREMEKALMLKKKEKEEEKK